MNRVEHSVWCALALLCALMWLPAEHAEAHIKLLKPLPMYMENGRGDPQSSGPCGGAGTASNVVTEFHPGETITVQWQETMAHPGHYRIALAKDQSELKDPDVPLDGSCNYAAGAYDDRALMYPVIADHLFPRDQAAVNAPNATHMFSQDVKLPNTPCEKCVLQVIQFMTMHTPPCSYYHCAMVSLKGDPVAEAAGTSGGSAGGGGAAPVAAAGAGGIGGIGGMTLASGAIGTPQAGAPAPAMIAMPAPPTPAMASAGTTAAAPVTAPPLNMTPAASTVPALPAAPQSGAKQGCSADGSPAPAGGAALALLALLAVRRRRTGFYSR